MKRIDSSSRRMRATWSTINSPPLLVGQAQVGQSPAGAKEPDTRPAPSSSTAEFKASCTEKSLEGLTWDTCTLSQVGQAGGAAKTVISAGRVQSLQAACRSTPCTGSDCNRVAHGRDNNSSYGREAVMRLVNRPSPWFVKMRCIHR